MQPRSSPDLHRILYHVMHETRHRYQRSVMLSQQMLHLTPRAFAHQDVISHQIEVVPVPQEWSEHTDYFGNQCRGFTLGTPHRTLIVRSSATVALLRRPNVSYLGKSPAWEDQRLRMCNVLLAHEPIKYMFESPHVPCSTELAAFALPSFTPRRPLLEAAYDMTHRIFKDFEFDGNATTIATPVHEVLTGRRGVCQDFAHLMIGCMRSIGLPARYVSGYILTSPPPGQVRMVGADASHAWVSVYATNVGWVDCDPTNRRLVEDEHITVAWGRDFSDVTPMRGTVLGGGAQDLVVSVTVTPLAQRAPEV